jgi:hypothetical protein
MTLKMTAPTMAENASAATAIGKNTALFKS